MPEHSAPDPRSDSPEKDEEQELSESLETELGALEAVLPPAEDPGETEATPDAEPPKEQPPSRTSRQAKDKEEALVTSYAHPDVLVSTEWVEAHRGDEGVRLVEVNVDHSLYDRGHLPGAVGWSWKTQLADPVRRDILSREQLEDLLQESGIENETTVVLYGDSNNWFAAWAFWQLKVYGHEDVCLMDGGRNKWEAEGREMTTEPPMVTSTAYWARPADASLRALLPEVRQEVDRGGVELVDVRGPQEFSGEILAPEGLPETCQRGGHIPGASNIPWSMAVAEDGTIKPAAELREIYRTAGITGEKPIITYGRIGECSSHSWFVLKYLLGENEVRNYDGSWTEWGNLVGAPVEVGPAAEV